LFAWAFVLGIVFAVSVQNSLFGADNYLWKIIKHAIAEVLEEQSRSLKAKQSEPVDTPAPTTNEQAPIKESTPAAPAEKAQAMTGTPTETTVSKTHKAASVISETNTSDKLQVGGPQGIAESREPNIYKALRKRMIAMAMTSEQFNQRWVFFCSIIVEENKLTDLRSSDQTVLTLTVPADLNDKADALARKGLKSAEPICVDRRPRPRR